MATAEKGTPRPWEVHEGEDYIVILGGEFDTTDNPIARVYEPDDADLIVKAVNSYHDLLATNAALVNALTKIAAFNDEHANGMLADHGRYTLFDEPNAVKIAREALAHTKESKS